MSDDDYPARIVLAVDRSAESEHASYVAGRLSARSGGDIYLVHVRLVSSLLHGDVMGEPERERAEAEGREVLADRRRLVEEAGGQVADEELRYGKRVDEQVISAAEEREADVLVIGGRGESELTRTLLLGDTAASIVRHAPCSVYVARRPRGATT